MKHLFSFALFASILLHATGALAQDDVTWELVATVPDGYVVGMEQHASLGSVALSTRGRVSISIDSGRTWKNLSSTMPQANGMTVNAFDPNILYAATNAGVYASADAKDWDPIGLVENVVTAVDIARGTNLIMAATNKGIFFSGDLGLSWDERNDLLPKDAVNCIGTAWSNYTFAGTNQGLYKHLQTDFDWQETSIKAEEVTALRINGSIGDAWAGTTNAIYYCENFESTWAHKFTTPAEVTFIWNPAPAVLVGTTNGVYYSSDNGQTWKLASSGINAADVTSMMTSEDHHILLATRDGSIYKSREVVGSTLSVKSNDDEVAMQVTPNPSDRYVTIITPSYERLLEVQILDVTGRKVITSEVTGSTVMIATWQLPGGSYSALIRTTNGIEVRRFIVQH
jgi:photosystem II stability/assembly factor-like uncharacterized protein